MVEKSTVIILHILWGYKKREVISSFWRRSGLGGGSENELGKDKLWNPRFHPRSILKHSEFITPGVREKSSIDEDISTEMARFQFPLIYLCLQDCLFWLPLGFGVSKSVPYWTVSSPPLRSCLAFSGLAGSQ